MSTNTDELKIEEYSDKSIVVRGNTKNHIQAMKDLGGLYNARLRDGAGWIFTKTKRGDVEAYISKVEKGEVTGTPYESKAGSNVSGGNVGGSTASMSKITEDRIFSYLERLDKKMQDILDRLEKLSLPKNSFKSYSDDDDTPAPTTRLLRRP